MSGKARRVKAWSLPIKVYYVAHIYYGGIILQAFFRPQRVPATEVGTKSLRTASFICERYGGGTV